jgi:SOS response associated peptidase (SRAP)
VLHMAALYDVWHTGEGNETLGTFTILTTDSSPRLRWCGPRGRRAVRSNTAMLPPIYLLLPTVQARQELCDVKFADC